MTALYAGRLESLDDARAWLDYVIDELGLNFHWDTRAEEYEDIATGEPTFSAAEVQDFEESAPTQGPQAASDASGV